MENSLTPRNIGLGFHLGKRSRRRLGIIIALGSNRPGIWGGPIETLQRALEELARTGLKVGSASSLYSSAAVGSGRLEPFVNGIVTCYSHLPPCALLRVLKRIERAAGPRSAMPWGPRPLDLDIVDYKGLIRNWRYQSKHARRAPQGSLALPHIEAHRRPFVVLPLEDAAPGWRHPVLKCTARELLRGLWRERRGHIIEWVGEFR